MVPANKALLAPEVCVCVCLQQWVKPSSPSSSKTVVSEEEARDALSLSGSLSLSLSLSCSLAGFAISQHLGIATLRPDVFFLFQERNAGPLTRS